MNLYFVIYCRFREFILCYILQVSRLCCFYHSIPLPQNKAGWMFDFRSSPTNRSKPRIMKEIAAHLNPSVCMSEFLEFLGEFFQSAPRSQNYACTNVAPVAWKNDSPLLKLYIPSFLLVICLMSNSIHLVGFLVGIPLLKRHHHEDVTRMCYAEITSILLMEEIRLTTWDR